MKYKDMTPEQKKAFHASVKKSRTKHRKEYNERQRKYRAEDTNSSGVTKSLIRVQSHKVLDNTHDKLQGYEIHHCFGYEDPNKFIYIPRTLHIQIHQMLRDRNIQADSDHWNVIRDLVNSCDEYTYIRC